MKYLKKFIMLTIILAIALSTLTLIGCVPNAELPVKWESVVLPTDGILPHTFTLEWIGTKPNSDDNFDLSKPTVILLEGVQKSSSKSTFSLDTATYDNEEIVDSNAKFSLNTANSWIEMGYNVGVFHYEQFADDTDEMVFKKLFSESEMQYKDANGAIKTNKVSHNLVDIFVARWLNFIGNKAYKGEEVRLIGNNVGATFAMLAAGKLIDYVNLGVVDGNYSVTRLAITNPYLSNKSMMSTSPLNTASALSLHLTSNGIMLEMIESKKQATYNSNYSETDTTNYNKLVSDTAYLYIDETYSEKMTAEYRAKDKVALDWYLISVLGSDDTSIGNSGDNIGPNNSIPVLDRRDNYYSTSLLRFGVSAWTPSSYIRAIKGLKFRSKSYGWSSDLGESIYTDKVNTKFRAEMFQCSDMSRTLIAGYVFGDVNRDGKMNDGFDSRIKNVVLSLKSRPDYNSEFEELATAVTDKRGFYMLEVDSEYVDKTLSLTVITPSHKYGYLNPITEISGYRKMSYSTLGETNDSIYPGINKDQRTVMIRNCGFFIYDK